MVENSKTNWKIEKKTEYDTETLTNKNSGDNEYWYISIPWKFALNQLITYNMLRVCCEQTFMELKFKLLYTFGNRKVLINFNSFNTNTESKLKCWNVFECCVSCYNTKDDRLVPASHVNPPLPLPTVHIQSSASSFRTASSVNLSSWLLCPASTQSTPNPNDAHFDNHPRKKPEALSDARSSWKHNEGRWYSVHDKNVCGCRALMMSS